MQEYYDKSNNDIISHFLYLLTRDMTSEELVYFLEANWDFVNPYIEQHEKMLEDVIMNEGKIEQATKEIWFCITETISRKKYNH